MVREDPRVERRERTSASSSSLPRPEKVLDSPRRLEGGPRSVLRSYERTRGVQRSQMLEREADRAEKSPCAARSSPAGHISFQRRNERSNLDVEAPISDISSARVGYLSESSGKNERKRRGGRGNPQRLVPSSSLPTRWWERVKGRRWFNVDHDLKSIADTKEDLVFLSL